MLSRYFANKIPTLHRSMFQGITKYSQFIFNCFVSFTFQPTFLFTSHTETIYCLEQSRCENPQLFISYWTYNTKLPFSQLIMFRFQIFNVQDIIIRFFRKDGNDQNVECSLHNSNKRYKFFQSNIKRSCVKIQDILTVPS